MANEIGNGTDGASRLARIEAHTSDIHERVVRMESKMNACPVFVHAAYFRIIAGVLTLIGAAVIGIVVKVFSIK